MANAARKLRKLTRRFGLDTNDKRLAEAHRFVHTKKQGTPFLDRAVGPGADHKGNARPSQTQAKRNMGLHLAANPPAKLEYIKNDKGEPLDLVEEQARIMKELVDANLDPKPYRIGRKRYSMADIAANNFEKVEGMQIIWAPRKQYDQQHENYLIK